MLPHNSLDIVIHSILQPQKKAVSWESVGIYTTEINSFGSAEKSGWWAKPIIVMQIVWLI